MVFRDIDDLADPRLDRFREIRQRNPTRFAPYFIAEGRLVVERLLASRHKTQAILLERGRESLLPLIDDELEVEILRVAPGLVEQLVGFDFHRGVMACGTRPVLTGLSALAPTVSNRDLYVVAHEVQDPTNLGNMIRTSVAFGAKGMILGRATADPFSRRVMRVSMGTALELDFYECWNFVTDLPPFLQTTSATTIAATLRADAENLSGFSTDRPVLAFFGNEGSGLPSALEDLCQHRVRIPMSPRADSLNVSVATGIFLYELTRRAPISSS